ncbi:hypothetical protein Ate02nite_11300 [Paractinoplanes tereljensis]|uniref:Chemotaxis protein CheW n=2 Tax=Paractinoplanes tereljensis TaxID=571912 RepID=A0A919NGX7_9ACTN|nr:hypothetical protein Ate02nite_11300 [Actinoplanes tereljensis]
MDPEGGNAEFVTFDLAGERYAFPMSRVREIIRMPSVVRTPLSPPSLAGLADLRGRVLPVVSLRTRCGLPDAAPDETSRVIVLDGRVPLGFVVDRVAGVLSIDPAEVRMPATVDAQVLVGVIQDGGSMTSVLNVDRLVGERVAEVADAVEKADEELFVVFRLDGEEYAVDVDAVQEIIRVPPVLIRVPRSYRYVEGLVNLRGAVLPVVDLRTRLGLRRVERDERQRIVVLIVNGVRAGLIVDSVAEVARVGRHLLEPAPKLSAEQARVVSRVANLPERNRMFLLVELDQLLVAEEALAAV